MTNKANADLPATRGEVVDAATLIADEHHPVGVEYRGYPTCDCGWAVDWAADDDTERWVDHFVQVLGAAGVLADPEHAGELEEWRAQAKRGAFGWVALRVRTALGTPDGRAVSVHAAEVVAERDSLQARYEELQLKIGVDAGREYARAEGLQTRLDAVRAVLDLPPTRLVEHWDNYAELYEWADNARSRRIREILDSTPCTCLPDCCLGEGDPPNRCEHCATIDGELPCPIADAEVSSGD